MKQGLPLYLATGLSLLAHVTSQFLQYPIPFKHGNTICDGLSKPIWEDCDALMRTIDQDVFMLGPNGFDGESFKNENCTMRFVQCDQADYDAPWELTKSFAGAMFTNIRNSCGEYEAGGGHRQSDACLVVESPRNPYVDEEAKDLSGETPREKDDSVTGEVILPYPDSYDPDTELENAPRPSVPPLPKSSSPVSDALDKLEDLEVADFPWAIPPPRTENKEPISKRRGADLAIAGHTKRDDCEECMDYKEHTFIRNVRGPKTQVCDNILQNGDSCTQTKSVTTEESYSVGVDIGGGFLEAISLGASFGYSTSSSTTKATANAFEMRDCPNGGYFVWWPLMEISKGRCGKGEICGKFVSTCFPDFSTEEDCQASRPIEPADNVISGEYGIQCL